MVVCVAKIKNATIFGCWSLW